MPQPCRVYCFPIDSREWIRRDGIENDQGHKLARQAQQAVGGRGLVITDHHAKYFAHELSRRHSAADSEKLAGALFDAQVDLNPHQVSAALFAFKSPLSKGAILADEVGLGKTIEAGLLLSQKWAEGKRRILIITPASLRKQWVQEMRDKFFLPAMIMEAKNYNRMVKDVGGGSEQSEGPQSYPR